MKVIKDSLRKLRIMRKKNKKKIKIIFMMKMSNLCKQIQVLEIKIICIKQTKMI